MNESKKATRRSLISWAVQSMTCGSEACTNFQREMERTASEKLGDRPARMFCTTIFSSDCAEKK